MTHNDAHEFTFQKFLAFYRKHPDAENSLYYTHFPEGNKDTIRSYKSRARKTVSGDASPKQRKVTKSRSPQPPGDNTPGVGAKTPHPSTFQKIDDDAIEFAILELVNHGDITPQLINSMISFYEKIRGKDDKIKDDIDMEAFIKLGKTLESSD